MDLGIRLTWGLFEENVKTTYLHFERGDGGGTVDLTPMGVPPGVTFLLIMSEALASPTGRFYATQDAASTRGACMPLTMRTGGVQEAVPVGSGCFPVDPPPPPPTHTFAESFHHRDHLGNLRVVTDATGGMVAVHDYYPFGMEIVPEGGSTLGGSRKRFTGHERDEQTGLDYMLARYHSPSLARFITVDSAGPDTRNPQSFNRYAYALNNPIKIVDPDGNRGISSIPEAFDRLGYAQGDYRDWVQSGGSTHSNRRTLEGGYLAPGTLTHSARGVPVAPSKGEAAGDDALMLFNIRVGIGMADADRKGVKGAVAQRDAGVVAAVQDLAKVESAAGEQMKLDYLGTALLSIAGNTDAIGEAETALEAQGIGVNVVGAGTDHPSVTVIREDKFEGLDVVTVSPDE